MSYVKMITLERLLEMKTNDEDFVLVDALPEDSFREGRIPGAISLPADEVASKAEEQLGKDDTIVVYCANYVCEASTVAARKLLDLGYTVTMDYKGGKQAWQDAGFDLE